MRKICFVGYAIPESDVAHASGVSIAGNKMQLNILRELCKYDDVDIYSITIYPCAAYPADSKLVYRKKRIALWDGLETLQIGFLNIPIIKQLCQMHQVYHAVKKFFLQFPDAEVFAFNMYPQVGTPLRRLRLRKGIKVTAILADLPIDVNSNRKGLSKLLMDYFNKQTRKNIRSLSKAIVLNPYAANRYLDNQKYIVIEGGICVEKDEVPLLKKYNDREKIIVYAGELVAYNGIDNLLKAMELVHEQVILRIYGDGPMRSYVEAAAISNDKIEYRGKVPHQEMLAIQKDAYFLINPRPISNPISQVTFPSKIFEYLVSGTVVLSTRLNGFTEDYLDKMILMEDGAENMAKKIDESLMIPFEQMEDMAKRAYEFVVREKNWERQGEKIHDFLVREN